MGGTLFCKEHILARNTVLMPRYLLDSRIVFLVSNYNFSYNTLTVI